MARLEFSELAESDIDDILDYIAHDNAIAALQFVESIRETCRHLSDHPDMGISRPRLGQGDLRSFAVSPYLIFYTKTVNGIVVARVLHGARDLNELFE